METEARETGKMRLLSYMKKESKQLAKDGLMGRAGNFDRTRKSFSKYLGQRNRKDIFICSIDNALITGYRDWLTKGGISENSALFYLRNLHSAIGKAVKGNEANQPKSDAFEGVPLGTQSNARHLAVDSDTIREIMDMDVERQVVSSVKDPKRRTTEGIIRRIGFARDLFIFSFCAQGMDFVDMCYLKKEDVGNGHFRYTRRLTKMEMDVEILPQMSDVMERYGTRTEYVFPMLTASNAREQHRQYLKEMRRYNHSLSELARMLSKDVSLSSASARDSWALAAYQKGMPLNMMAKALGLKDEASALKYLRKFEVSGLGQANRKLIDSILG